MTRATAADYHRDAGYKVEGGTRLGGGSFYDDSSNSSARGRLNRVDALSCCPYWKSNAGGHGDRLAPKLGP